MATLRKFKGFPVRKMRTGTGGLQLTLFSPNKGEATLLVVTRDEWEQHSTQEEIATGERKEARDRQPRLLTKYEQWRSNFLQEFHVLAGYLWTDASQPEGDAGLQVFFSRNCTPCDAARTILARRKP